MSVLQVLITYITPIQFIQTSSSMYKKKIKIKWNKRERRNSNQSLDTVKPVSSCIRLEILFIFLMLSIHLSQYNWYKMKEKSASSKISGTITEIWNVNEYSWRLVRPLSFKAGRRFFYCSDAGCAGGKIKTENMKRSIFKSYYLILEHIWFQGYMCSLIQLVWLVAWVALTLLVFSFLPEQNLPVF